MENFSNNNQVMVKKILSKYFGNKKYFILLSSLIVLIILLGFLTPMIVETSKNSWETTLDRKIKSIQQHAEVLFKNKQDELINSFTVCKKRINEQITLLEIFEVLNSEEYNAYNISLFDTKGNLLAWNHEPIFNSLQAGIRGGETIFLSTDLQTFLVFSDTLSADSINYILIFGNQFEKYYSLKNEDVNKESFTRSLEYRFETSFNINYYSENKDSKDGRFSSFYLLNNNKNRIATVTFSKPTLSTALTSLRENISNFQAVLIILALLTLGLSIKADVKQINSRLIKFIINAVFLLVIRWLLFFFSVPAIFMQGELTNPAYFASAFGYGIVKSPLEFLITAVFFFSIALIGFYDFNRYYHKEFNIRFSKGKLFFWLAVPLIIVFSLFIIRGFAASVKSIIFDSTLRYFNETDIIPAFPHIVMNLAIMIAGIGIFIVILSIIQSGFLFIKFETNNQKKKYFYSLACISLVLGLIFLLIQNEPLIGFSLLVVTLLAIFFLAYRLVFQTSGVNLSNYLLIAIAVSIVTVSYLNHFNTELEKESLKTAALEINRPNENLLNFLINETLIQAYQSERVIEGLKNTSSNFDALAFIIWSQSGMKNEPGLSSVSILNKNRKIVGSYSNGIDIKERVPQFLQVYPAKELKVFDLSSEDNPNRKVFSGIIPISDNNNIIGYIAATVILDGFSFLNNRQPSASLFNGSFNQNKNLNIANLNIFSFLNDTLLASFGNLYPAKNHVEKITNAQFNEFNEAWLNFDFNNENYLVYALKSDTELGIKTTAVCLKDKEIEWSLFNFFKLFFLHTLFLLLFFIIVLVYRYVRFKDIQYTFRTQLLAAFLIISILPIISLAVYNRQNVSLKSDNLIKSTLSDRIQLLETHIKRQKQNNPDRQFLTASEKAAKELDLTFFAYDSTSLVFFSTADLVNAGIIPSTLNAVVHMRMNFQGVNEDYFPMEIDNLKYHAFFKKVKVDNKEYILSANDLFYKVINPFSSVDVDVFLFGTYSVAILLIILSSTLLSGKISSPIRRLTRATKSVAHGDLNIQLDENERGEIKELINGFNYMTKELKKNQEDLSELERENAWREMAKQVAHEIKNPLTPMKLTIQQLIASYKDGSKNFEKVFEKVSSTLLNQIESLSQIASEFSRFARMPNPNLSNIDLLPVLSEVKYLFNEEHVKIEIQSDVEKAVIEADHSHLRRTIINLVRNSIQAGSSFILFRLVDENCYSLIVSDNGKGIESVNIDKLFEKGFSTKDTGMGIGLKLSKRFIESIGGKISLKETSDKGTSFEIQFPKVST